MLEIMARYKKHVEVIPVDYKYSFGNQGEAKTHRNSVQEYTEIIFLTLKPCGCGCKISSMRFYNMTIVLYRTNARVSHFISQNHIR